MRKNLEKTAKTRNESSEVGAYRSVYSSRGIVGRITMNNRAAPCCVGGKGQVRLVLAAL